MGYSIHDEVIIHGKRGFVVDIEKEDFSEFITIEYDDGYREIFNIESLN